MAAEVVVKVTTQGGEETLRNINEIKDALSRLESEASTLDLGSDAFEQSKTQIDELKRKLEGLGKSQRQLDDDISRGAEEQSAKRAERMEKVGNDLAKFAAGVTDAFAGAFIAFGAGEEDAKKFNETLQKGLGIAIGVKGGIEALTAGVQLAGPAFEAFNAIMAANPIGVVVVAVAALAAGIYLLINAMKDEEAQSEAVTEALNKSNLAHLKNQKILDDIARKRKIIDENLSKEAIKKLEAEDASSDRILENEKNRLADIKKLREDADGADVLRAKKASYYSASEKAMMHDTEWAKEKAANDKFRAELKIINDRWDAANRESGKAAFESKQLIDKEAAKEAKETAEKSGKDLAAEREKLRIELLEGREKELEQQKESFKKQSKIANDGLEAESKLEKDVREDNNLKIANINYKYDKLEKEANDKKNAEIAAADQAAYDHLGTLIEEKGKTEEEIIAESNAKKLALSLELYEAQEKIRLEQEAKIKKYLEESIPNSISATAKAFASLNTPISNLSSTIVDNVGTIYSSIIDASNKLKDSTATGFEKFSETMQAVSAVASAVGNSINSILSAIGDYQQQKADEQVERNEKELENAISNLDAQREAELAKEGLTADQKIEIENRYAQQQYALKLQEYNNNTAIKKQAFEQDKKLKIAQAVISTISGAIAAFTGAMSLGPIAGPIVGALLAAAVVAMGAMQVSQISNTKFDAGTPPAAPKLQAPSTSPGSLDGGQGARQGPELYAAGGGDTGTTGGQGFRTAAPPPQKVYVVSQEVTSSQNMDAVIERRSSF